jgi:hypothetical protein
MIRIWRFLLIIFSMLCISNNSKAFYIEPKFLVFDPENEFKITPATKIIIDGDYGKEFTQFTEMLKNICDYNNKIINIQVDSLKSNNINGNIIIASAENPIIRQILNENNLSFKTTEGFSILINEKMFLIAIGSKKSFYYAINNLKEILAMSHIIILGKNMYLSVPSLKLLDYPTFDFRALHITLFDTLDKKRIKQVIDKASEYRFNYIVMDIDNGMKFVTHPEVSKPNAFSKEEIKEIIQYSNEKYIEVIPQLDLLGHQEWLLAKPYPDLILKEGILKDNHNMFLTYDPQNEKVYKIVFDLLNEIIDVFNPKFLHIGHDEAFGLRIFDAPKSFQLFANHINRINQFLSKKGIKTIIWGDMLKKEHNGGKKDIYKAIDLIEKDVIIADWVYSLQSANKYGGYAAKYFIDKGFQVLGATFKNEDGIKRYSTIAKSLNPKPLGMIACTWYYLPWGKMDMVNRIIEVSGKNFWK